MNKILFKLNERKSLCLISSTLPIEQVYLCYDLKMYWVDNNDMDLIGQDSAGELIEQFERVLYAALDQKLILDKSIRKNLGYYWNEIFADRESFVDLVYDLNVFGSPVGWVGSKYLVWSTQAPSYPLISTWMYNDMNGNIVLEVSEMFAWSKEEDVDQNNKYAVFLKNYKPLFKEIISQRIAQQWLHQVQELYAVFYKNEQKCRILF